MNGDVLVILPRGRAGEIFAQNMAKELVLLGADNRVGFSYPYLPEFHENDPALLQQIAALIREGLVEGISEFMFTEASVVPVLSEVEEMLFEGAKPIIYNPVIEARNYFSDPQERPLWLDRWKVMQHVEGFETLYSLDRPDLRDLIREVIWRTRGVTGGVTETAPEEFKGNLLDENYLRLRSAQLLFKLAEISSGKGILLGSIDLAMALTRYIDEEFRDYISACRFVNLSEILAKRLV